MRLARARVAIPIMDIVRVTPDEPVFFTVVSVFYLMSIVGMHS